MFHRIDGLGHKSWAVDLSQSFLARSQELVDQADSRESCAQPSCRLRPELDRGEDRLDRICRLDTLPVLPGKEKIHQELIPRLQQAVHSPGIKLTIGRGKLPH